MRPLPVELHSDPLIHPRARGFSPRTVELYRQIGLEPAIEANGSARADAFAWAAVRAEPLADATYRAVEAPGDHQALGDVSPSPYAPIDQDKLEILLRAKADRLLDRPVAAAE